MIVWLVLVLAACGPAIAPATPSPSASTPVASATSAQAAPRAILPRPSAFPSAVLGPHEQVALSPDGRVEYVTGGHSFANQGCDGISVVDLQQYSEIELAVPDRPLDIVVFSL